MNEVNGETESVQGTLMMLASASTKDSVRSYHP